MPSIFLCLFVIISLVSITDGRVFGWVGFYERGTISSLVEIDVATGKVGPRLVDSINYIGRASCTDQSTDGTFTCVGSRWEFGPGNITIVSKDAKLVSFPTPKSLKEDGWLSGTGVSTFENKKYLVGIDDSLLQNYVYSINQDHTFAQIGKPLSFNNNGLVDSIVATPTKVWIGLGNISQSHWDKVDYQFAGIDITGKNLPPIVTPRTKEITWSSCFYSKKQGSPVCLTKASQANGVTRLVRLDDATGDIKVICDKIDGVANNIYTSASTFDSATETFYFLGIEQHGGPLRRSASEHASSHQNYHQGLHQSTGKQESYFYTLKMGECAAKTMVLSGFDVPGYLSLWQLLVM